MSTIFALRSGQARSRHGFTLVEVLVSMVLLLIIVLAITGMINSTSKTYRRMTGQVSVFQEAALVFDSMTRTLGEATLKTYLDYYPDQAPTQLNSNPSPPTAYMRRSDLHFRSGIATTLITATPVKGFRFPRDIRSHAVFFHAPLDYTKTTPPASATPTPAPGITPDPLKADYSSSPGLLAGCGYYISYDTNSPLGVPGLNGNDVKKRFRLVRLFEPTEELETYSPTKGLFSQWFNDGIAFSTTDSAGNATGNVRAVADNIVALFIEPRLTPADQAALGASVTLAPQYSYDSRAGLDPATGGLAMPPQPIQQNQLPPIVRVTMVAIDEASGARLVQLYPADSDVTTALYEGTNGSAQFTAPASYDADMAILTANLVRLRLNFRVFSADVPIRAAKWSTR